VKIVALVVAGFGIWVEACLCQPAAKAVITNLAEANWTHEAGDPPGSESVALREDRGTGALELLVRYPAGHVFAPHWHSANERIILLEGRLSLRQGDREKFLDRGGFAYLPAREVQRLSCVSKTPCTFYVYWDGKLDFNAASGGK
jgi:quercetin dioxygenase-like cupin family protein